MDQNNSAYEKEEVKSAFSWNKFGWFGGQIGATLWLILISIFLLKPDTIFGLCGLVAGLGLNAWGYSLWKSRDTISAYRAIQLFLFPASIIFAIFIILIRNRESIIALAGPDKIQDAFPYWAIGLVPAIMLAVYFRERRARNSDKVD